MPSYNVTAPDGKNYRVDAKSFDEARNFVIDMYRSKPGTAEASPLAYQIPEAASGRPSAPVGPAPSILDQILKPVTSYPSTYRQKFGENLDFARQGVRRILDEPKLSGKALGLGQTVLGGLGTALSPVEAGIETVVAKPLEEASKSTLPAEETALAAGLVMPLGPKAKLVKAAAKTAEELTGINFLERTAEAQAARAAEDAALREATTPIEQRRAGIAAAPIAAYQNYVGRPVVEFMRRNPLSTATAAAATTLGVESLPEDASISDKLEAAALYGLVGFAGSKALARMPVIGSDKDVAETFSRQFIDNYGLPADYLAVKQNAKMFKNEMSSDFLDLTRDAAKLSPEDRKVLYYMLQGEALPVESLAQLSNKSRETITRYGQKMVDVGLLNPETFEKNAATYLRREYADNLKPKSVLNRVSNQLRIIGSELKPRGVIIDIPPSKLDQYLAEGWEEFGTSKGGKVRVRRQLTQEERTNKGEIDDAAYAIARTGQLMSNDIATYKMYDDIARMPQYVSDQPVEGWVQLSGDKIPKTNITRYGNLAGKYVSPEVAQDLQDLEKVRDFGRSSFGSTYSSLLSAWKTGKTALNPAVHVNNIASNVMLYDLSGANWSSLASAANELRKGADSDLYKQAERLGVFDAGFASQELGREGKKVLDQIERARPSDNPIDTVLKIANAGWKYSGGKLIDAYQNEDSIFRFGIFLDRLKAGMSPEEAAKESKKWLVDYEINAPLIQKMRNTTHPFISYSYRAIPLLAESAALRPWKYAKWAAVGYGLNEYGESKSDADVERERRMMPERQKGTMFGIPGAPPTMVKLPQKEGEPSEYLDVSRYIPGGDVFATTESETRNIPLVPQALQPGGPLFDAFTVLAEGKDPFTGRPLEGLGIGATDTEKQVNDARIKGAKVITGLLPNLPGIPGAPATEKIKKAVAGSESDMQPKLSVLQAALQTFGIKVTPIDVEKLSNQQQFAMEKEIETVGKEFERNLKLSEENRITPEEMQKQSDLFDKRLNDIFNKYDKRAEMKKPSGKEEPAQAEAAVPETAMITGPDGKVYRVKLAPGKTEEDARNFVMEKYYSEKKAGGGLLESSSSQDNDAERKSIIDQIRKTPWFSEFVKEYGEEPDLSENADYDYVTAWKAGVRPERYKYDKNRFHWSSNTPEGVLLKKPGHPTLWKSKFMEQTGKNPDEIGIKTEDQAQQYLNSLTKKARGGVVYSPEEQLLLSRYATR